MKAANLYEQTSPLTRECVAVLLGFNDAAAKSSGYINALREIAPLPDDYKIGDVLRAYLGYLTARERQDMDPQEPVAGWLYVTAWLREQLHVADRWHGD
ncbi:hypothetical protein K788_0000282 [Paraburkholderia caribensis MBA4]|uniref:Uncharacterized protein n=1 Tax=Paraburkholderia caribensis MBA4 TaxID=1323664 RepID=A0A0P0RJN1_9BURK|nr:hypothetical protein [Paraburkholderia caribensis]ALL68695.1 hypothetical protein K788_0000282 [Paraburkholderia caribensis MBA4]